MLGRILLLLGLPLLASPALALTIYKYTDANGVVTYSCLLYTSDAADE